MRQTNLLTEEEFGPGDAAVIPPGHNAWVVGNEPVVGIDFTGLKDYYCSS
jgi:hypothetical protein